MHSCHTCRHWTPGGDNDIFGTCRLTQASGGRPLHMKSAAFAADDRGCTTVLHTHPSFVCSQYEPYAT